MPSLEKRITALESSKGRTLYHLSDAELEAFLDSSLAKMGTTMAEQIALYGGEQAMLTAMCKQAQEFRATSGRSEFNRSKFR